MFNKFESRKICVAGYQCDNIDFDFCIAEHNELPVIKICSDEERDDCQQLKPKRNEASFRTTTGRKNGFTRVAKLQQMCSKYHICTILRKSKD